MKKIVLSLSALFAISIASAQSYIKQPDPTTYQVNTNKAQPEAKTQSGPSAEEETPAQPADAKTAEVKTEAPKEQKTQQPATRPEKQESKVVQNRKR